MSNDLPARVLVRRHAMAIREHARDPDGVVLLLDLADPYARAVAGALALKADGIVAVTARRADEIDILLGALSIEPLNVGLDAARLDGEVRVIVITAGFSAVVFLSPRGVS